MCHHWQTAKLADLTQTVGLRSARFSAPQYHSLVPVHPSRPLQLLCRTGLGVSLRVSPPRCGDSSQYRRCLAAAQTFDWLADVWAPAVFQDTDVFEPAQLANGSMLWLTHNKLSAPLRLDWRGVELAACGRGSVDPRQGGDAKFPLRTPFCNFFVLLIFSIFFVFYCFFVGFFFALPPPAISQFL